jgi:hypothetical protein
LIGERRGALDHSGGRGEAQIRVSQIAGFIGKAGQTDKGMGEFPQDRVGCLGFDHDNLKARVPQFPGNAEMHTGGAATETRDFINPFQDERSTGSIKVLSRNFTSAASIRKPNPPC